MKNFMNRFGSNKPGHTLFGLELKFEGLCQSMIPSHQEVLDNQERSDGNLLI